MRHSTPISLAHESGSLVERDLFEPEHDAYRDSVRRFVETELQPHHHQWEKDGIVPRDVWLKAGAMGMLCPSVPEDYSGIGGVWIEPVTAQLMMTLCNGTAMTFHGQVESATAGSTLVATKNRTKAIIPGKRALWEYAVID